MRHEIDLKMLVENIMKSDLLGREKLYLEKLLNRTRWIPCSERMPECEQEVLVYAVDMVGSTIDVDCISEYTQKWRFFDGTFKVTHWMPLPEPPEREEEIDGGKSNA